jgi:glycosyltransferase involved in cell wall biosynthesis
VTPPRVLMAVGAYYPELAGGSLQCRSLVLALQDRVRFSVLATTADRGLPVASEVDGVPVHRIFVDPEAPATKALALARLLGLAPALASGHDIFHFHGFTEKMLVLFAIARVSGRRIVEKVTSVGWDDPIAIRSRPFGSLLAAGIARADRLVAVTPAVEERCRRAGLRADRVRAIPNGVDVRRFAPIGGQGRGSLRGRLGLPREGCLVTWVGFWSRQKGPHVLFDAWRQARARAAAPTTLLFIGSTDPAHAEVDASLVADVKRRIAAERLGGDVMWVERTDDIAAYLQASDVFALPSSREGMSNALLEAMATGLPCIAAAIPGVTDAMIDSGHNGFIVPAEDADALATTLIDVLSSESRRVDVGRQARETTVQKFSMSVVANQYLSLYNELTGVRLTPDATHQ